MTGHRECPSTTWESYDFRHPHQLGDYRLFIYLRMTFNHVLRQILRQNITCHCDATCPHTLDKTLFLELS
jgi:hypothetical protein